MTFEQELYRFLESRHPGILRGIAEKKQLDDQLKADLNAALPEFTREFLQNRKAA
jgi:F-type H+-transporting ATPase subunit alpha